MTAPTIEEANAAIATLEAYKVKLDQRAQFADVEASRKRAAGAIDLAKLYEQNGRKAQRDADVLRDAIAIVRVEIK